MALKPIVVVGSCNMDLVSMAPHLPKPGETVLGAAFHTNPGGKGANQAVAVARLGHPVHMIGCVGEDGFGQQLREALIRYAVDVDALQCVPGPSGVASIVVAEDGENSIVVTPGANAALSPERLEQHLPLMRSAGMVLAQLEVPLATVEFLAQLCEREGVPLMLDPAPGRLLPASLLNRVTWLTPNGAEAALLCGGGTARGADAPNQIAQQLRDRGAHGLVLKRGGQGAVVYTADSPAGTIVPAFAVPVRDTTAAGDAFNAAFAVALLRGFAVEAGARFACAAAALAVTRQGAQEAMPSEAEVQRLIRDGRL